MNIPPISPPCQTNQNLALARQAQLTKPPGSLGRLEQLAVRLASLQRSDKPTLERVWISVFAADHGVAAEGVSAFPQSVTRQMVRNFLHGGAAINVLAQEVGARLEVVDVGILQPIQDYPTLVAARAGDGTENFVRQPAMSKEQLELALRAGSDAIVRAQRHRAQLFVGGEMGIANTTSATALACALLGASPGELAGPGTGLDPQGVDHKRQVIETALQRHAECLGHPLDILCHLGGFEIAALTSAYLHAASAAIPSLIDGFIASVAALLAVRLQPACGDWLLYSHRSAEPGHRRILEALQAEPLLDLSMRLGEGSGAALAVPILRAACALHNRMATFAEAGVSEP